MQLNREGFFCALHGKLRDRNGESIAEVLLASLIGALAMLILVGMISAASHMTLQAHKAFQNYYDGITSLMKKDAGVNGVKEAEDGGTVQLLPSGGGLPLALTDEDGGNGLDADFYYIEEPNYIISYFPR